jgi:hypothetical protein
MEMIPCIDWTQMWLRKYSGNKLGGVSEKRVLILKMAKMR